MKQPITLFLIFSLPLAFAQISDGYHNSTTGNDYQHKTQLYNIINQQNDQGYGAFDGFFR